MRVPLIEPYGVLDEKQRLLRQERRAQCGCEVELMQEHSDHSQVGKCEVRPSHWVESTMTRFRLHSPGPGPAVVIGQG